MPIAPQQLPCIAVLPMPLLWQHCYGRLRQLRQTDGQSSPLHQALQEITGKWRAPSQRAGVMGAYWKALCIPDLLEQVSIGGEFHCQGYMVCCEENLSEHDDVGVIKSATASVHLQ